MVQGSVNRVEGPCAWQPRPTTYSKFGNSGV